MSSQSVPWSRKRLVVDPLDTEAEKQAKSIIKSVFKTASDVFDPSLLHCDGSGEQEVSVEREFEDAETFSRVLKQLTKLVKMWNESLNGTLNPSPLEFRMWIESNKSTKTLGVSLSWCLPEIENPFEEYAEESDAEDDSDDEAAQWFNDKYPMAACHRCEKKLNGYTVKYCGGYGGACETWYCAPCKKTGTADCDCHKDEDK